jgi:hypothetical protein
MDWVTISSLATAGGTLVLAVATFSSVRSANRTARAAERSLAIALRPLLVPSRRDDPAQKIMFADEEWVRLPGGAGIGEVRGDDGAEVIYLAMSLHNAGRGLGIIHGWRLYPARLIGPQHHPPPETFRMQGRDLYIPVNDTGFWQAAFRDRQDPEYAPALEAIKARTPVTIDLLYGDYEGGQRVISRFSFTPREGIAHGTPGGDGAGECTWFPAVVRHWNVDGTDTRPLPPSAG